VTEIAAEQAYRVFRATYRSAGARCKTYRQPPPWELLIESDRDRWRQIAVAAIGAERAPAVHAMVTGARAAA